MNAAPSDLTRLSRPERRDEVRRLYFRCQLPMQRIAAKLGVTRYTVWRDVRWWQERMPELANPDRPHNMTEILRKMGDLETEAWRALIRSQEDEETRTETFVFPTEPGGVPAGAANNRKCQGGNVKCTVRQGRGDPRMVDAITRLLVQQAKLIALAEDRAAKAEEEQANPNVVIYLPDNGRDRKECGMRSADCGTSGEFGTRSAERGMADRQREMGNANSELAGNLAQAECGSRLSAATCGRASASNGSRDAEVPPTFRSVRVSDEIETELKRNVTVCNGLETRGCVSLLANASSNKLVPSAIPLLTSGATGTLQRETENANRELANRLQPVATHLQQNETAYNAPKDVKPDASNASLATCRTAPAAEARTSVTPVTNVSASPALVSAPPVTEPPRYRDRPFLPKTNEGYLREMAGERMSLFG